MTYVRSCYLVGTNKAWFSKWLFASVDSKSVGTNTYFYFTITSWNALLIQPFIFLPCETPFTLYSTIIVFLLSFVYIVPIIKYERKLEKLCLIVERTLYNELCNFFSVRQAVEVPSILEPQFYIDRQPEIFSVADMSLCHFKICNMGRKRQLWVSDTPIGNRWASRASIYRTPTVLLIDEIRFNKIREEFRNRRKHSEWPSFYRSDESREKKEHSTDVTNRRNYPEIKINNTNKNLRRNTENAKALELASKLTGFLSRKPLCRGDRSINNVLEFDIVLWKRSNNGCPMQQTEKRLRDEKSIPRAIPELQSTG